MNACGHHHVGHIGILGVDKNGEEWYQIEHRRQPSSRRAIGKVIGPSFARADVPDVIERLIETYLEQRDSDAERFVDVVHRIGIEPFKRTSMATLIKNRQIVAQLSPPDLVVLEPTDDPAMLAGAVWPGAT